MKRISSGEKVEETYSAKFGPVLPRLRKIDTMDLPALHLDFGWVENEVSFLVNGVRHDGLRIVILAKGDA